MADIYLNSLPVNYYAKRVQTGEFFSYFIENPHDKDYKLVLNIPYGGVINLTTAICTSGSTTGTFKINNPTIGVIPLDANSITTGRQSVPQIYFFNSGDDLFLTLSSGSNCGDVTFTVQYARAYN